MQKILVTGGLGFIGSHTAVELQQAGFEVVIIDDLSNSLETTLDGIAAITGRRPVFERFDLRDKSRVGDFFARHADITGIIHFAAAKAVGESVANPLLYYENNLGVLIHILQALSGKKRAELIFSSSCTVYGQADTLPISEAAPIKPAASPYGNTKQVGEAIIQDTCRASPGLAAIALRYFNPIGAHPSLQIGELPLGVPQNLLPFITQTAIGRRAQLAVFGDDYPTPDGTCIRDYIHVVDLAEAHVLALQRLLKRENPANFEVFNLGAGRGSSVLEVIQSFERVTGETLNYRIAPRRAGDVPQAWADTRKANAALGWQARFSLDEAVQSAWEWEKKINNKTRLAIDKAEEKR